MQCFITKSLLYKIGYTTKTHDGLIAGFAYEYVKKRNFSIDCFKYLTSSRSMRTKASYDYTVDFDEKTAKERISYMQRNICRYIHMVCGICSK